MYCKANPESVSFWGRMATQTPRIVATLYLVTYLACQVLTQYVLFIIPYYYILQFKPYHQSAQHMLHEVAIGLAINCSTHSELHLSNLPLGAMWQVTSTFYICREFDRWSCSFRSRWRRGNCTNWKNKYIQCSAYLIFWHFCHSPPTSQYPRNTASQLSLHSVQKCVLKRVWYVPQTTDDADIAADHDALNLVDLWHPAARDEKRDEKLTPPTAVVPDAVTCFVGN